LKISKFPNALVIMLGFIIFACVLTYIIPHGQYERTFNPELDYETVVPGSYKTVQGEPVSLLQVFMAIPEGIIGRADLVVLILLVGGCFYVIDKTGAFKETVVFLTNRLKGQEEIALVAVSLAFTTGGALSGLQEEIIAMIPVLIFFTNRLGYNAYVAVSVSFGSAVIGSAFSPVNPFAIVIAQDLAELPFLSGSNFRLVVLFIAFVLWMMVIIRYGNRNRIEKSTHNDGDPTHISKRSTLIISLVIMAFALLIYGMLKLDWGFNEITAEFFILGIICGLIGKLGMNGTSESFIQGAREMSFAAIIMGLANSISIVLKEGLIIDSIIYGLFLPMQYLPAGLSAISMMISQAILHFPVPSYSGQAVLTMPILAPLSDLLGLSRQVCVLAYQYGAVTMDLLIPTNGALMAVIALAGIPFNKWLQFAIIPTLVILTLGAIALLLAIAIGL
jgi:uncharacterized ion transporter superfamily protein YfcC